MTWNVEPLGSNENRTNVQNGIVVYGTSWCGMTQMIRRYLDRQDIPYQYLDIDNNSAAANQLRWITGGTTSHPTVVVGGHALIEPTIDEFENLLAENGYL